MKGLLWKDFCNIRLSLLLYAVAGPLFVFLILGIGEPAQLNSWLCFFILLNYPNLIFDEKSGWERLAVTMPFSRTAFVSSKYLSFGLFSGAMVLIVGATQLLPAFILKDGASWGNFRDTIWLWELGWIYAGVMLPVYFIFGEKVARVIGIQSVFAFFFWMFRKGGFFTSGVQIESGRLLPRTAAVAVFVLLSLWLSVQVYRRKEL
ncbi:MAG: ABC-2 transporter permease [Peptostreptococcaceae bacterium]|nr:ABC-2 transporter permease [Peptostreptococcaceae bacterium]